tara:strand:+ start:4932 stop:5444 length:513 start_codon:yes stop_codon:yes gene_type:complete
METVGHFVSAFRVCLIRQNEKADDLRKKIHLIESKKKDPLPPRLEQRLNQYRHELRALLSLQSRLEDSWYEIVVVPIFRKFGKSLGRTYFGQVMRSSKRQAEISFFRNTEQGTQGLSAELRLVKACVEPSKEEVDVYCKLVVLNLSQNDHHDQLSMKANLNELIMPLRAA